MKVTQSDENTLIVRPGGIGSILFGLVFLAAGLFVVGLTCIEYRLICDRAPNRQVQCRLNKNLFGITLQEDTLSALQSARIDTHHSSKGTTHKVIFITASGEIPLGIFSNSDVQGQQRFVEAVNTFVQYPNLTQLDVAHSGIKMIWFGIIFCVLGSLISISGLQSTFTTWVFDRMQGTVVRRSETLLGIKTNEYALRDIAEAQVTWTRGRRGGRSYRVELVMRDETTIPLTSFYSSGHNDKKRAAAVINLFLQQG